VDFDSLLPLSHQCLLDSNADESITIHKHRDGSHSELSGLSYDLAGLDASKLTTTGCPMDSATSTMKTAKSLNIQVSLPEAPLS
jgi:hypothetical protein